MTVTKDHLVSGNDIAVGVVLPRGNVSFADTVAYETSASALEIGQEEVVSQQILNGYTFRFSFLSGNCSEIIAVGSSATLIVKQNVSALIGPPCNDGAVATAPLSAYFNIPTFLWGLTTSSQLSLETYPSVMTVTVTGLHYAVALANVVDHFGWNQFAYIYGGAKCADINTDLAKVVYRMGTIFTSKTAFIPDPNPEALKSALSRTRVVARKPATVRRFLLAAFDLGMINNEFLYIIVNSQSGVSTSNGTLVPMWQDVSASPDGRDADAMAAYQKAISISTLRSQDKNIAAFRRKVVEKMRLSPFNCIQECANPAYQQGSQYSYQLYNIILLYAKALNRTLSEDPLQLRNGSKIISNTRMTFAGIAGPVTINSRGQLVPTLIVSLIDRAGNPVKIMTVAINNYEASSEHCFTSEHCSEVEDS
ncbi:ligand-binding protein, receptor family [Ancylostoma ceylanicum]|uniref:Ligand-binding protein, receptor family n=1 Tax=Ancylostoma ceylanicum TaxID=53326 RepID=A0A0D6LCW6_9BILA|nr:ligand-binding protein, receptor family [Ancylostoma ceylanicum]